MVRLHPRSFFFTTFPHLPSDVTAGITLHHIAPDRATYPRAQSLCLLCVLVVCSGAIY